MTINVLIPGLSLRSNPGLKLANAFGVIAVKFKLMHYWRAFAIVLSLLLSHAPDAGDCAGKRVLTTRHLSPDSL